MRSKSSWAGLDLRPLPFESAVSCLWRFGWRNKLNANLLKDTCSSARGYPQKDFFDNQHWLNRELFLEKSTWQMPTPDELDFIKDLDQDERVWVERTFRYCPLCLEYCFHSFWHQFIPLNLCPIHDVPLSTKCHCCDKNLPQYGFSKSLFEHPYYCIKCLNPIAGVKPELSFHLAFREQAFQIDATFRPFMIWWQKTRIDRLRAYEFDPKFNSYASRTSQWCKKGEFLRSLVCNQTALPFYFTPSLYPDVTVLHWRIRICEHDQNHFPYISRRRSWAERVRIPTSVYRCTLRLLTQWIARQEGWNETDFNDAFVKSGNIPIRTCPERLLALHCMRWQLENGARRMDPFDPLKVQLKDEPSVGLTTYFSRTPRRAWLAIFLAIYVSWYFRILKAKDNEADISWDRSFSDDAYLFLHSRIEAIDGNKTWVGAVTFPTVDGIKNLYSKR